MDENEEIKDEVVTTEEDGDETTESGGLGVGGAVLGIGIGALIGVGIKKLWNHFHHPKTKWIKVPIDENGEIIDSDEDDNESR